MEACMSILTWHTTTGWILQKLKQKLCLTETFVGLLWLLHKLNTMLNKVRIINQNGFSSSSSLALQPFKFGTCFRHDRCPFCSAQVFLLHLFTPIFLRSYSTSSIHIRLGPPFLFLFFPSSVLQLLFYQSCTLHSFNMPNLLQHTYFNYRIC